MVRPVPDLVGAAMVMIGSLFAGHEESPGQTVEVDGKRQTLAQIDEAVRASKVMTAVEVPEDVLVEVDQKMIGRVLGKVDFSGLYVNLSGTTYPSLSAAKAAGAATINYGLFINTVIDFLILAFIIFQIVRIANKMIPKPVAPPATKDCPYCLSAIPIKATRCAHCTSDLK